jgi:hypothetical protein
MRNPAIYSSPYRINQATATPGGLSQPAVVTNATTQASIAAGLEPGDITKYDALPWQADFNECSNQPIDITYEDWAKTYPASTGDPFQQVIQLTYWWPAHRPMYVQIYNGPNASPLYGAGYWSPTPQNHSGDLQMVTEWANLGFVLRNPSVLPGTSLEFVNVQSGNASDLPKPGGTK